MKKKSILFLATFFLLINVLPVFAQMTPVVIERMGSTSTWRVIDGGRNVSMLGKTTTSGVVPVTKKAWFTIPKTAGQLARFAAGTLTIAGLLYVAKEFYDHWDEFAEDIGAALGWVKVDGVWMKYQAGTSYTFSDVRAVNYFFQVLVTLNLHQEPPHANILAGVYQTETAALAAATARRNLLLGDPTTYTQVSTITSGTNSLIGPGVQLPSAAFRQHQVGAKLVGTTNWNWWYYLSPVEGGATVITSPPVPLTPEDKKGAIEDELLKGNPKAKGLIEDAEKAANIGLATGTAWRTDTSWCGPGKSYSQCLDEWAREGTSGLEETIGTEGEPVPTESPEDVPNDLPEAHQKIIERLDVFKTAIGATGIGSMWDNMFGNIPTSDACEMEINLSERFGGYQTISFCSWGPILSVIASVLMLVAGYAAVKIIIGKGGA